MMNKNILRLATLALLTVSGTYGANDENSTSAAKAKAKVPVNAKIPVSAHYMRVNTTREDTCLNYPHGDCFFDLSTLKCTCSGIKRSVYSSPLERRSTKKLRAQKMPAQKNLPKDTTN